MALEKIGLGGVLTFDNKQAVRGMGAAGRAADRFKGQFNAIVNVAKQVGAGMAQAGQAMRGFGVAALPATAAIGLGVSKASDFETQMSAVRAVSGATAEQMGQLEMKAKALGASTAFSATQAGEGFENLARAGFSVQEQLDAIGPVLNAASADGIDLATASGIVSNTLRALAMDAGEAGRVADVLALASASANTDITALGEAMKFSAPQAKSMNIELEQLTAILGAAADAGLKGTLGGTSFTQAMVKLLKPSSEGQKLLDKYNITINKTEEGFTDAIDLMKQVRKGITSLNDPIEESIAVTELFGVRGQKAVSSVLTAIESGKMDELAAKLYDAEGAAERMAKIRLDNLSGAFTLLASAAEGFALETAGAFLGPMREGVDNFTGNLSTVVQVLQELNSEQGLTTETANKAGTTWVAVATGIKEGIDTVIDAWTTLRESIMNTIAEFTGSSSPEMLQQFTKMATMIFIVAGAVAPVLIALGGLALFVTSAVIPAFSAIGTIVGAVFGWPFLAIMAAAGAAFLMVHREGESIGETFQRIFEGLHAGFNWVMDNAVKPFISGVMWFEDAFAELGSAMMDVIRRLGDNFGQLFSGIFQAVQALAPLFSGVFTFLGNIVGGLAWVLGAAFTGWLEIVNVVVQDVKNMVLSVVESVVNFIKHVSGIAGEAAAILGLDFADQLIDFGRGEFRIKTTSGERGIGPPETPAQTADELAMMEAERIAAGPIFTPGNIEDFGFAVGEAVAANSPKDLKVESKVCVDGKTIAKATSKHRQELNERAGFKATPWQRRASVEQGAAPVGGV